MLKFIIPKEQEHAEDWPWMENRIVNMDMVLTIEKSQRAINIHNVHPDIPIRYWPNICFTAINSQEITWYFETGKERDEEFERVLKECE